MRARQAEGTLAGEKVVEQHAEREEVRAWFGAELADLFGRDVGRGAHGQVKFGLQQIRHFKMPRQAEVDEHRFACRADHDVGWLEVVVDDLLAMQVDERCCDLQADRNDFVDGQRRAFEGWKQRLANNTLHRNIWNARKIADAVNLRHMRPGEPRQDHHLHFKADDHGRVFPLQDLRHLEDDRPLDIRVRRMPQHRHAAGMQLLADDKAVYDLAFREVVFRHPKIPLAADEKPRREYGG